MKVSYSENVSQDSVALMISLMNAVSKDICTEKQMNRKNNS